MDGEDGKDGKEQQFKAPREHDWPTGVPDQYKRL